MVYVVIAGLLLVADTIIKYRVERYGKKGVETPICGGRLLLKKYHNTGAMLNLGAGRQKVMAMISLLFTVFMTGVFTATLGQKGSGLLKTGLALILGGAFSNTYDRLARKYVVDYVSFDVKNSKIRNIIFNISDFGIIIGAAFLVAAELLKK